MPENLTRTLLAAHRAAGSLEPGADLTVAVDQVLIEDATGSMCAPCSSRPSASRASRSGSPCSTSTTTYCRSTSATWPSTSTCARSAAATACATPHRANGISHYVHLERFARPRAVLVGAGSHSTMAGDAGMLAMGAGGLDVAVAMAGHGYPLSCPRVVEVALTGRLGDWVEAKDVILELLRRRGVRGGAGTVFEFTGPGVATLSVTERATICNMITETGATGAVFSGDERVREWLADQQREDGWTAPRADEGAGYDEHEHLDLSTLEPLVAVPHSPGDVVPVREVAVVTGSARVRRASRLHLRTPAARRASRSRSGPR